MKPFDLDAAKRGKKIITRDGREAKFVAHVPEADANYRVVALVLGDGKMMMAYPEDGGSSSPLADPRDLFMAPPKERMVWVNFYTYGTANHFDSESEAVLAAGSERSLLARAVPVTILVEE